MKSLVSTCAKSKFYGAIVLNRRVVLHAIDATRVHLTMKWVVSFLILRPFGPRCSAQVRAGPRTAEQGPAQGVSVLIHDGGVDVARINGISTLVFSVAGRL